MVMSCHCSDRISPGLKAVVEQSNDHSSQVRIRRIQQRLLVIFIGKTSVAWISRSRESAVSASSRG